MNADLSVPVFSLRPGVSFPDWSAVTSDKALAATLAMLDATGTQRRWHLHSEAEDRVRSTILRHYARTGHAPDLPALQTAVGLPAEIVEQLLIGLADRDLIVRSNGGRLVGAYPFTDRATGHRARVGKQVVHAMCAIDALGAGAMLDRDIKVESSCRACGAAIHVTTRDRGGALGAVSPSDAVVRAGTRYDGGCAANSCCTVIAFFCSPAHREEWCARNASATRGFDLSMSEALEVGRALFGPALKAAI
jgi:mercuric reductase